MLSRLHNKVVLITGAANGIGRAAASAMAKAGARGVVLTDVDGDAVAAAAAEVSQEGAPAIGIGCDVSNESQMENAVKAAMEKFGGLHCSFLNAGVMLNDDGDEKQVTEAAWDKTMAVNVKGVLYGCRYSVAAIKQTIMNGDAPKGGSIINTASFVAHLGAATSQLAYTASKGAVLAMTRELAVIHAREGVRVNALSPGPLQTELLMKFLDTEEKKQRRLVHVPMGRFGLAEEMANAAVFLASDESSFMTGHSMLVDGGITSAYVTAEGEPFSIQSEKL
mmetsp:Transcript_49880/g.128352  ORF Transcript_49880/g.128352 Transcript_49880/m.128352 type:complete len:279 (-) Transcript_49880:1365-2201(-)|eukprot:CAMPEP_0113876014 /NCGR_PEP_ID=MMETSP0780_2-20120614/5253_1 /TAXON_ID=652834 /ORGANISM="Palpitomonas bilix" /LENGTH=278 /DNA_ID=CAMNT_0000862049 /DNA_START=53 /DNA_END=889 /DNA_ORIENTATION=+ /assembly_acc=CAM_ASM_000599